MKTPLVCVQVLIMIDAELGFFNFDNFCARIDGRLANLAKSSLLLFRKKLVLSELRIFLACPLIARIDVIKRLNFGICDRTESIPTFLRHG